MARAGWCGGKLSASKLCQSSSISGPSLSSKPRRPKMSAMRSIVRLTGCRPPRSASRPGRVTSRVSEASRASSAASSRLALRSPSAAVRASRAWLIASPAALRWSAGSVPSCLSWAVTLPCLPSRETRRASTASGVSAEAMSARACCVSDSIPVIAYRTSRILSYSPQRREREQPPSPRRRDLVKPSSPRRRGPMDVASAQSNQRRRSRQVQTSMGSRLRGNDEQERGPKTKHGEGLAPFPMRVLRCATLRRPGVASTQESFNLRRERALRLLCQRRKTRRVVHGDVRQHLAVEGDAGLQQAVHETAVAHAIDAGSRIDAGDPQRTEIALLLLATDVGVLQGLRDRLLGDAENLATGVVVALGLLQDLLVTAARLHATLDSCHCSALLRDTAACDRDGLRPRHERGSSAAGCASAWSPSW